MDNIEFKSYAAAWKKCDRLAADDTLTYVGANITRIAAENAPLFIGNLRRSIAFTRPRTEGGLRIVEVGFAGGKKSAYRYAMSVERGRRPGKPPPSEALKPWVEMKLGVGRTWKGKKTGAAYVRKGSRKMTGGARDAAIASSAFLVARAIGRKGSPAQPFLLPAYDVYAGKIGMLYQRRFEAYMQQAGIPK